MIDVPQSCNERRNSASPHSLILAETAEFLFNKTKLDLVDHRGVTEAFSPKLRRILLLVYAKQPVLATEKLPASYAWT